MAWDKGFNFRLTSGFVVDGTNETYCIGLTDVYPLTRNGVTFGWASGTVITGTDGDNSVDRRLAGRNYAQPGIPETFRVDLPAAGDYVISLANGDTTSSQAVQGVEFLDNTTSLFTVNNASVAQDTYYDATSVNRSEANWPGQNLSRTSTFTGTIFILKLGSAIASYSLLAHLFLSQVVVGVGAVPPLQLAAFPKFLFRNPIPGGRVGA